jgi:hypothetical protein
MSHIIHPTVDRRVSLAIGAAVALVALVFAWSATLAAPGSKKTDMLTIPWKVMFQMHQSAPAAFSWGDTLQATYTFTGDKKGTADFVCTVVATHFLCQGIIRLPDAISTHRPDRSTRSNPLPSLAAPVHSSVCRASSHSKKTPMTPASGSSNSSTRGRTIAS